MPKPHTQSTDSPGTSREKSSFQCAHINGLGGVTLEIRGRLDIDAPARLERILRQALADVALVVLDLQAVVVIDSATATAIVRANRAAHANGRRLVIAGPPRHIRAALEGADAEGALTVVDSSEAARVDPHSVGQLELDIQPSSTFDASYFLACRGEIDAASAPQLRDAIAGLELSDVIVDLTGTSFMDSTGLSTLLNALRRLTRQEHRLVVVCPPGRVREVIQLTALLETLNVVDDVAAAEQALMRGR